MSETNFGRELVAALWAVTDRQKLSGAPDALSRRVIGPIFEKEANKLAMKYKIAAMERPKARPRPAEMDEIWLQELEADNFYEGINVRLQYGLCLRHFGDKRMAVSRARFRSWLGKRVQERGMMAHSDAPRNAGNIYAEPANWRTAILLLNYDQDRLREMAKSTWSDVPPYVRKELV